MTDDTVRSDTLGDDRAVVRDVDLAAVAARAAGTGAADETPGIAARAAVAADTEAIDAVGLVAAGENGPVVGDRHRAAVARMTA